MSIKYIINHGCVYIMRKVLNSLCTDSDTLVYCFALCTIALCFMVKPFQLVSNHMFQHQFTCKNSI